MNNLMQTEHDDEKHIKKIKEMKHFSDLGDPENRLELDYVHAKIVKFLILDPRDFNNCINILYVFLCQYFNLKDYRYLITFYHE